MKIEISLYKPLITNADYGYNERYKRFNCPWENKLFIEGRFCGTKYVHVNITMDTQYFDKRKSRKTGKMNARFSLQIRDFLNRLTFYVFYSH